ncbi:MAG: porin [Pseudomonadota bacterium]
MQSKLICAALAMGAASSAGAQNVTIYGFLDTGVEYINHVGPLNTNLVRMPNLTGSTPSRFGFRGTEDLGGGVKAFFILESGIGLDTGALNYGNRLFGRQALIGLSSSYGTLTLGRQWTMTFHAMMDTDILGPNIYAMGDLDGALPNARSDNTVGYLGKFGGLSVGATYSLGRDAAGPAGPQATNCPGELATDKRACKEWTAMVKYDSPGYGVSASYDKLNGGPGALFGLTRSDFSDERSTLNGYAKIGRSKVGGGVVHRRNTSAASFTSNLYYLGALHAITEAWVVDAQVARLAVDRSGNDSNFVAARVTYNFSRRTAAYLTAGHMVNQGSAAVGLSPGVATFAGADPSAVMLGLRHAF